MIACQVPGKYYSFMHLGGRERSSHEAACMITILVET